MPNLPITNVINISVATPPAGLSSYKINNLAIFNRETPIVSLTDGYGVYLSPSQVATDWGTASEAYSMANAIFSQTPNILTGDGQLIIYAQGGGQTLSQAIVALSAQIFFGGCLWAGYAPNNSEVTAAVTVCQAQKTMIFVSSNLTSDLSGGGLFSIIKLANQTYGRCLLYTVSAVTARLFAAAYAGRGMSVNFAGSLTTLNMNLKDLVGILPDPGINQTVKNSCETVGVDIYANVGGLPKVFSFGGNDFFDNVYNVSWFVFQLQVNMFNALATTSTKIPQTEQGMAVLNEAATSVCQMAINNGFIAPGKWNSPETFGNPDDLRRNILDQGYYLYSQPVNQQPQVDRAARKAPLTQLAIKFAGGVNTANLIVYTNA